MNNAEAADGVEQGAALAAFCRAHPLRSFAHGTTTWHYRIAGDGARGLLLLPGAVGDGEAYFTLEPLLRQTHRLIAIAYPNEIRLDALLDGLVALASREGVTSVDVLGGSFGGLLGQALIRRHPSIVHRVVLSATGPAKRSRVPSQERSARVVEWLPLGVTRALLRTIVRASLKNVHEARAFWRMFYFDAIGRLTKEQLVARYHLSADVDRRGPLTAEEIAAWPGEVLILEGGADRVAHGDARSSLKAAFPRAVVRTFAGAGHAISAEHTREWAATIAGFLSAGLPQNPRHPTAACGA